MIGNLVINEKGEIENAEVSIYQPPKEVRELTGHIQSDFVVGRNNLNQPYRELGNVSITERANRDQRVFNNYVDPPSEDPSESWRFNGMRPLTRNKVMTLAAQLTSRILYPNIFAQNDQDETDEFWAKVMRDLILWHIRNSDYEMTFLFGVISALVNPISYFEVEFIESVQKIRTKLENGEIEIKEAIDEVFTGLNVDTVPLEQILFANPYGGINLQKQRFLFRHKHIEFAEAQGKYGEHENWRFVRPGIKTTFSASDSNFYDEYDESLDNLVEEVVYYNRTEDMEIPFVNGIYMGKENIEDNAIKHRDNNNRPKYKYASFGYHPIDEKHFVLYKSLVFAMENEQTFVDTMLRMTVDGTFLALMPPRAITGSDQYNVDMNIPGSTHAFNSPETRIQSIAPESNLQAGYQAIQEAEKMANENSISETLGGQLPEASQKAFNVARAETNARINLSIFGKMIGKAVSEVGDLMKDLILAQQTVAETIQVLGGATQMKYRSFVLPDQVEDGKKVTKKIRFNEDLIGVKRSEEEELKASFRILEEEGGIDGEDRVINVNPRVFRQLRFHVFVDPDVLPPQSEAFEKAINLEAWQSMIQSPFANREAVDRDFLFETFAKGDSSKYMKKANEVLGAQQSPQQEQRPATGGELLKELAGTTNLANAKNLV